ncbi:shikimate kinase [Kineococcus xinjiangensis]|uniref:Shikimate kinase n=1 Tax=Kineococcus xinjiangensis TaxID=512762 RepID=A0A2S6IMN8_9ACTN|nr:AAA family ATPase [Kineococcus xinjiangensis]PPK95425.1 shikimate kinase [Kineococcus xinjiangensis]
MLRVLITGMSGTGKSTVLTRLAALGHRVVDTDSDAWSRWTTDEHGRADWVWREEAITGLLTGHRGGSLFVAGCKSNQGRFYPLFEHVVLLSAPASVLLERIAERTTNDYGKDPAERALVLRHIAEVEPLLRRTATLEIDTTLPLDVVVHRLHLLR